MNIFVLHSDSRIAAKMQCDKHIVKMPLETAQMLCTAVNEMGGAAPYKTTHKNHPCSVWVRESIHNFLWLYGHGEALCKEYRHRFGKVHKSQKVIEACLKSLSLFPSVGKLTPPPLCMPNEYKGDSVVQSYRDYYNMEKHYFAKWDHCDPPKWWVQ